MQSIIASHDLLEFQVSDADAETRGTVIGEVIGQAVSEGAGVSVLYVYPLAASEPGVLDWALLNLAAPSSLHLCHRAQADVDVSASAEYIQRVERWRIRDCSKMVEPWCRYLVEELRPLPALPRDRPLGSPTPSHRGGRPGATPPARRDERPARGLEPAKDAVSESGHDLMGDDETEPPLPPPGRSLTRDRRAEPELPPPALPGLRGQGGAMGGAPIGTPGLRTEPMLAR